MFTQYVSTFYQAVLSFFSPENIILWWGKLITIVIILVVAKMGLSIISKLIEKSLTPLKTVSYTHLTLPTTPYV